MQQPNAPWGTPRSPACCVQVRPCQQVPGPPSAHQMSWVGTAQAQAQAALQERGHPPPLEPL
jgi:hypothetical protein